MLPTVKKIQSPRNKFTPHPPAVDNFRPRKHALEVAAFRLLSKYSLMAKIPAELVDLTLGYLTRINSEASVDRKTKKSWATEFLRTPKLRSARRELKAEEKQAKELELQEECQNLLRTYGEACRNGDEDAKCAALKKLEKARPITLECKLVLSQAIWATLNGLASELEKNADPDSHLCLEDMRPLKDLDARWSASIARAKGKHYLFDALKTIAESGLIRVTGEKPLTFVINNKAIKLMIKRGDPTEHGNVVQLVNCLLVENVAQAQALWDSVRSHSNPKSDIFNTAKAKLDSHLDRCIGLYDSWKSNPDLDEHFFVKWQNFELDATKKPSLTKKLTNKILHL